MRKNQFRWIACLMCMIMLSGLFDLAGLTAHALTGAELTADDYPEYDCQQHDTASQRAGGLPAHVYHRDKEHCGANWASSDPAAVIGDGVGGYPLLKKKNPPQPPKQCRKQRMNKPQRP